MADLDQRENGATARIEIMRGEALAVLERHEKAAAAFRRAIALAERGGTEQLEAYYGLITAFDCLPNKRDEQLAVAAAGVELFPFDAQLLCATGNILRVAGRADLAAVAYQTATQHGQVNVETWHLPEIAEIAGCGWAMMLDRVGRGERGLAVLEHLCAQPDAGERVIRQLLNTYVMADMRAQRAGLGAAHPTPAARSRRDARGGARRMFGRSRSNGRRSGVLAERLRRRLSRSVLSRVAGADVDSGRRTRRSAAYSTNGANKSRATRFRSGSRWNWAARTTP
ncbi:MAG: hypothetical protein QM811_20420 [Pirellulales bacterium]